MSAYVHEGVSPVISLKGAQGIGSSKPELQGSLPILPKIDQELEAYFQIARQLEAALQQERNAVRRSHDQLRELIRRNEVLADEKRKLEQELSLMKSNFEQQSQRDQTIKNRELEIRKRTESSLQDQLRDLSVQLEEAVHEKKKVELNTELIKANLDFMKQREKGWSTAMQGFQTREAAYQKIGVELTHYKTALGQARSEIAHWKTEIQRFKTAWTQVSSIQARSQQVVEESGETKRKLEEMAETLSESRGRVESTLEQVRKEKRDKQIALNCLHTAEKRIDQLTEELERLRNHALEQASNREVELKLF